MVTLIKDDQEAVIFDVQCGPVVLTFGAEFSRALTRSALVAALTAPDPEAVAEHFGLELQYTDTDIVEVVQGCHLVTRSDWPLTRFALKVAMPVWKQTLVHMGEQMAELADEPVEPSESGEAAEDVLRLLE